MKFNQNKIIQYFKKSESRAQVLLNDKKKTEETIQKALNKASANKKDLSGVWVKMQLLFSIAKDYARGHYTQIPKRSIIAILGGLVYFLSPVDIIPDFVPFLGFVDDIFILNLVYKQVLKDLEKYQQWKNAQVKLDDESSNTPS